MDNAKKLDNALKKMRVASGIYKHGQYIIITGKKTFSLDLVDATTYRYPEILPYSGKTTHLDLGRCFVEGGGDCQHHLLDLAQGRTIHSFTTHPGRWLRAFHFAVSPDKRWAYDYWKYKEDKHYIGCFDTKNLKAFQVEYPADLRVLDGMVCIAEHELLVLEAQGDSHGGESRVVNQISHAVIKKGSLKIVNKKRWTLPSEYQYLSTDGRYVLYRNMHVYDTQTGNIIDLLENTQVHLPLWFRNGVICGQFYKERNLLQLYSTDMTTFIDCEKRAVAAIYSSHINDEENQVGLEGCLIGNEFWWGTSKGIIRKPFPMFEEVYEKRYRWP